MKVINMDEGDERESQNTRNTKSNCSCDIRCVLIGWWSKMLYFACYRVCDVFVHVGWGVLVVLSMWIMIEVCWCNIRMIWLVKVVYCLRYAVRWYWSYGVMVSTLDFESSDPGSIPGRTFFMLISTRPSFRPQTRKLTIHLSKQIRYSSHEREAGTNSPMSLLHTGTLLWSLRWLCSTRYTRRMVKQSLLSFSSRYRRASWIVEE